MTRDDRYVNVVVGFYRRCHDHDCVAWQRCVEREPLLPPHSEAVPEPTNLSASTNVV
jgi:hypothetical protein